MSWFEEQIKERKIKDNELFSDSIENIGNSILGKKVSKDKAQLENDEIKAILKYYGFTPKKEIPIDTTELESRLSLVCRPFGLMFRRIKLTENWYKDSIGAILAFNAENETAVALIPDGFGYHFNRNGKSERVNRKNAAELGEEGYCFYKPFPNRKINLADLTSFALRTRSVKDIVLLLVFLGISTLIGLLSPKITHFLFSTVVESKSTVLLFSTIFFYICACISKVIFDTFNTLYNSVITEKLNVALEAATMMRILSLPPSFFRKYASGDLAERSNYLSSLAKTLMSILFGTFLTSLFSLVYLTSIFKYAPSLAIPSIIIILVSVSFSILVVFLNQKISREIMQISAKESGIIYAMFSGIKKIRIAGAEKRAFARWANLFSERAQRTYNPPTLLKVSNVISLAISTAGTIIMYFIAIKEGTSMAEYAAFTVAYGMVNSAFSSLTGLASVIATIKPNYEMAKPLMDIQPEIDENKEIITKVDGRIEFNNVVFSYQENTPLIVDNMSFKIEPNQYIAIVGKTGCGKSTIIRLLLGFEKPRKSAIYFDGKDINSLDLKSLRKKIGVVMQDGKLSQGDIFSNIVLSAPWLTLKDAWAAADIAGISEDIEKMPMGMHTYISEGFGGISGGQKQRLMIARAIAPKPKILIFDEATSALDNITQKKISDALDELNCTRIVIAHRLSTIKHCDRILYLGDGRILEDGTYDELIEKKGLFYELVERQRLDT